MSRWSSARIRAFHRQNGLCFYCRRPMWERELESRDDARDRLGIHGSKKAVRLRQCTAEHLVRKVDGGKGADNIVASCAECNHYRQSTPPEVWAKIRAGA